MKTCPMCYSQIEDDAVTCASCGAAIMADQQPSQQQSLPSAGRRVACPWCLSACSYELLYTERRVYRCPFCTKAFVLKNGKPQRSDGTSAAARALALIIAALVILPAIIFGCR
jgi:DNA-directed RNA polymerase subunit RPC12/RpoP